MKSRECMYCQYLFDCKGRGGEDYCLRFSPQSDEALERYREWRKEQGKENKK